MESRCIIGAIRNLSKELDEQLRSEIKRRGLPILLNHIPLFYILPSDGTGMRFHDLMTLWRISKSSLSDILRKYEAEGLITKTPSSEDKRTVYIAMTQEAIAIREVLDAIEDDLLINYMANFSSEERSLFEQMVTRMSKR